MPRPAESRVSVFSAENRAEVPVYPLDVFVLTDAGANEIHGGATRLPAETQMYVPKVEATILRREGLRLNQLRPS